MQLSMCCSHSLSLRQEIKLVPRKFTVFPMTEKVLEEHELSLQKFDVNNEYKSIVDAVFCNIYPQWKEDCMKYYDGDGKQLQDRLSKEELLEYDLEMSVALEQFFHTGERI